MSIDASSFIAKRIIDDATTASHSGDGTSLQVDARELQADQTTWRNVDSLIGDYNKSAAQKHLPDVTVTHDGNQTQISEKPNLDTRSVAQHFRDDAGAIAVCTAAAAAIGTIGPPGGTLAFGVGGFLFGTAVEIAEQVKAAMKKQPIALSVDSK